MANNGYNRNYNRNYRSGYNRSTPERRKRRNRKRLRNRIIIVGSFLIILFLIILLFSLLFRSCFGSQEEPEKIITETIAPSTAPQSTSGNTSTADVQGFTKPQPEDNGEDAVLSGNNLLIWNGAAFELFSGTEDSAAGFANSINSFSDTLGTSVKIYSMVVPNHTEMGLPERLKSVNSYYTASQAENISTIYSRLDASIIAVNCYNTLSEHCNEYIYLNTDSRWTGLGAYYAYEAFANAANEQALSLEECQENKIENFRGTFSSVSELSADTVSYWTLPYETNMDITPSTGADVQHYDSAYCQGDNAYSVFINGDNPLTVLKSNRETGKKIAVIKDSFGNAFAPYLTYNYDEVHIIDFRYWEGNISSYCSENGIEEVLFINGIVSANDEMQVKAINSLL